MFYFCDLVQCRIKRFNVQLLLSCLLDRYGKPAVVDMMDVDMFDTVAMVFDGVQKGLMASLMSKKLLKDNKLV